MNERLKTAGIVAVICLIVGAVAYFGFNSVGNAGNLDQGQVQYTPGKPPWEETDPNKKGPGGAPGGGAPGANAAPAPQQNFGPAGGPPTISNSGN